MWHVGIDFGRRSLCIAAVYDSGKIYEPVAVECCDSERIVRTLQ